MKNSLTSVISPQHDLYESNIRPRRLVSCPLQNQGFCSVWIGNLLYQVFLWSKCTFFTERHFGSIEYTCDDVWWGCGGTSNLCSLPPSRCWCASRGPALLLGRCFELSDAHKTNTTSFPRVDLPEVQDFVFPTMQRLRLHSAGTAGPVSFSACSISGVLGFRRSASSPAV